MKQRMVGSIIGLCLVFIFLSAAAFADQVDINPTDDTHIYGGSSGSPDTNFSTAASLLVRRKSTESLYSLMHFDLSSVLAIVDNATLNVYGGGSIGQDLVVVPLTQSWVATEATFNSASSGVPWSPAWNLDGNNYPFLPVAPVVQSDNVVIAAASGWEQFDVTSIVQKMKSGALTNYGLAIGYDQWTSSHTLVSMEGAEANRPFLRVTSSTDAIPEPGTMLLLGTGILGAIGFIRRRRMR